MIKKCKLAFRPSFSSTVSVFIHELGQLTVSVSSLPMFFAVRCMSSLPCRQNDSRKIIIINYYISFAYMLLPVTPM